MHRCRHSGFFNFPYFVTPSEVRRWMYLLVCVQLVWAGDWLVTWSFCGIFVPLPPSLSQNSFLGWRMCRIWVLFACFVGFFSPRPWQDVVLDCWIMSVSKVYLTLPHRLTCIPYSCSGCFFFFFFLVSGHICVYRTAVRGCMRVDVQRINARLGWYSALVRQRGAGRKCSPRFLLDHAHFLPRSPCDHVACFGKYGEVDGGEKRRQQQWCAQPQTPTTPVGRVLWLGRVSHTRRTCSAASWSGERGWGDE